MKQKNLILMVLLALLGLVVPSWGDQYTPQTGDKITTDDGIFIVSGGNLITNPGFDDGLTGWKAGDGSDLSADNFEVQADGGPDGSPCLHAKGGAGSGSNKSVKTGWAVEVGKTYVFQCWSYRTASGMSSNTQYSRIYQSDTENGTDTQIGSIHYEADTWALTQIVFTATKPYLVANLGWLNAASSFDCFFLGEVTASSELATANLEAAIDEATALLASTEEGTGRGQYTTAVRQTLQDAISAATAVLATATTQDEVNTATDTLNAAIAAYKASVNPPFQAGKRYMITNVAAGLNLTTGDGTVRIKDIDPSDPTQVFTFEAAPEGAAKTGYNLKDDNGTYIYRSGSWDTKSGSTDLTAANAIFNVVDYDDHVQLRNEGSGSVLGVDNTTANSAVYSNKNGSSDRNNWTLTEVSDQPEFFTKNLEASIAEATELLASTEEGTGKGQYTTEVRAALQAAIDAAQTVLGTATEQSQINAANTALQEAIETYKDSKNPPFQTGVGYTITNIGANKNLAALDGGVKIKTISNTDSTQVFYFVPAQTGTGYNIHDANGTYIYKDSGSNWEMKSGTDADLTSKDALFTVEDHDSYILIRNANRAYLGTDGTDDGASVYDDKSGGSSLHQWTLTRHTPTAALEELIETAQRLLDETNVGTAYYEVPQSAADALAAAIATARQAAATVTTYEEASAACDALQAAIDTFNASYNPLGNFADGQTYIIRHAGGALLTVTAHNAAANSEANNATITAMPEEGASQDQLMTFEKATLTGGGDEYYIRSVSTGEYLSAIGDWNTEWRADNASDSTIVHIEKLSGKNLGLKVAATGSYLGTDSKSAGARVYSDKGAVENSYWTIEPYVTVQLDREAYNAALATADSLISATVIGYKQGMYFQSDLDAFKQTVATARANANKARSQEELDAVTAQLLLDIEAYKAKAHSEDLINRDDITAEIAKATATYNATTDGDLNGQYPAEARAALKAAIDAAQAVASDSTATQEAIDAALQALRQAETDFATQRVVIDYGALQEAVKQAQEAIAAAEPYKGEGPGKWPAAAFDALQALVDSAQAVMRGNTLNQVSVDALSDAIAEAVVTFEDSRVANDYTELQALVDQATELIRQAEAGEIPYDPDYLTDLKNSLEKNGAALESTDQDVIDRAAKMLKRDIAIFQLMVTGINRVTLDQLEAAGARVRVYDLNGQAVERPVRGIYIVRMTIDGQTTTHKVTVR